MRGRDNVAAAIKVSEYGTSIMPNDANLFNSLGEAYFNSEKYDLAKVHFSKSLALDADNKNAEEYLLKIEAMKGK